jgi:hypothetical protein
LLPAERPAAPELVAITEISNASTALRNSMPTGNVSDGPSTRHNEIRDSSE